MFGRKKSAGTGGEGGKFIAEFLGYQSDTDRMKDAARSSQRNIAILKPQIPIGVGPIAGWFGGNAAMPQGTVWPEEGGQKLLFVGQIDLSALPKDLWGGVGPRSGWLGIFLSEKGPLKPSILHFDGPLVEVKAPIPNDADWTRIFDFKEPATFALPKWPLIVETRPGNELHDSDAHGATESPEQCTLVDPAYHPFDRQTVALLCSALEDAVTRLARDIVRFPAMKKLRPADAAWFEGKRAEVLDTFVRFFEIEGRMRSEGKVDPASITSFIGELADLNAYRKEYTRTDGDGYAELILKETKLLDWQPKGSDLKLWWLLYEAGLTNHAIKAYTSTPTDLPTALRERVEAKWRSETHEGLAAMGHAPLGHIYTPHGPESPNEVLLEIHTSNIAGFIWGDCYSLVLLIDREALRRGDFSNVAVDITN